MTAAEGSTMNEHDILARVSSLVDQEHALRDRVQSGDLAPEQEQAELRRLEEALDQCWDLLRQRRARREFHQDPESAKTRPVREVESYQQ
jgi:hypothetical protein